MLRARELLDRDYCDIVIRENTTLTGCCGGIVYSYLFGNTKKRQKTDNSNISHTTRNLKKKKNNDDDDGQIQRNK